MKKEEKPAGRSRSRKKAEGDESSEEVTLEEEPEAAAQSAEKSGKEGGEPPIDRTGDDESDQSSGAEPAVEGEAETKSSDEVGAAPATASESVAPAGPRAPEPVVSVTRSYQLTEDTSMSSGTSIGYWGALICGVLLGWMITLWYYKPRLYEARNYARYARQESETHERLLRTTRSQLSEARKKSALLQSAMNDFQKVVRQLDQSLADSGGEAPAKSGPTAAPAASASQPTNAAAGKQRPQPAAR